MLKVFSHSSTVWLQVLFTLNSGWSQVVVMQPFEIIKVRLQTQSPTNKLYNGIADCLSKIIKNEGFFALYKGIFKSYHRKCHPFDRRWDFGICEIWSLWKFQKNLCWEERILTWTKASHLSKSTLCLLSRMHKFFSLSKINFIYSVLLNILVLESKFKDLRQKKYIQALSMHLSKYLKSTDSKGSTEVKLHRQ